MLTFSIDCHDCRTVYSILHIVLLVVLVVVAVVALTAVTALNAPTAWWQRHNNSSGKYWQWRQCQILTATDDRYWQQQPTDIDSADADGGGTLDQAPTSSAAYIRSYAKTFSDFVSIYNHLSHFHNPALACDRYHTYISCLPLKNILLVQALVMSYDYKWLLSHLNHLYTDGGEYQTCNYIFQILYVYKNFFPGIVKLVHMA